MVTKFTYVRMEMMHLAPCVEPLKEMKWEQDQVSGGASYAEVAMDCEEQW